MIQKYNQSCVIYKIYHKSKNRVYIGSTINFKSRKTRHLCNLRRGNHANYYLQASFNKYGEKDFEFIILEHCLNTNKEYLQEREVSYCICYDCLNEENYNLKDIQTHVLLDKSVYKRAGRKISKLHKGKTPKNFFQMKEKCKRAIDLYIYDKYIKTYSTQLEAAKDLNIHKCTVNNILRGKTKYPLKYPGYSFKFQDGKGTRNLNFNSNSIGNKPTRPIVLTNLDGSKLYFNSTVECSKEINIKVPTLHYHLRKPKEVKTSKNFSQKFKSIEYVN